MVIYMTLLVADRPMPEVLYKMLMVVGGPMVGIYVTSLLADGPMP
jgi:hypothetical protein